MLARTERGLLAQFILALLLLAIAALGLFAAWGRATERRRSSTAARVVFSGWGGLVERKVFTDLVAEFERRNPDVDVDYRPAPRDYVTKLKLTFAGGTPPDLFYIPDGDFAGFAVAGRVLDLEPFIARSRVVRIDEFWDSGVRRYRFDGRVFGRGPLRALPKDIGPTAMYVNLDLVRAAGLAPPDPRRPMTWDEALAYWKALTRDLDGDRRTDQWGTHGMTLEAAVWSHGGSFISDDARRYTMPDDARTVEAVNWLAGLQCRERVAPMERQREAIPVDTMFLTGRLATFVGGRWMVPQFRHARFHWDTVPIPVSPLTRREAGWSGSVGLAIAPASAHKDEAWRLLEFLAGPEGQAVLVRTGFQLPNQRALSATDAFLQPDAPPENAEVFIQAARHQQAGVPTRTPDGEWWDAVIRALGPVYRGEIEAGAALSRSRKEVQEALDRAWKALER